MQGSLQSGDPDVISHILLASVFSAENWDLQQARFDLLLSSAVVVSPFLFAF